MAYLFTGKIRVKGGGAPVPVQVEANDFSQAKRMIEMRPDFHGWSQMVQRAR